MHRWKKIKEFFASKNYPVFWIKISILDFYHTTLILLTSSIPRIISLILTWANRLENGSNNQPLLLITSTPKSEFSKVFYSTLHSAKARQWYLGIQTFFPVLSILLRVSKYPRAQSGFEANPMDCRVVLWHLRVRREASIQPGKSSCHTQQKTM